VSKLNELEALKAELKQKEGLIRNLESKLENAETDRATVQSQFAYSLAAMGAYFWVDNLRDGTALYSSPHFFNRLGYEDSEIPTLLDDYVAMVHPEDSPRVMDAFARYCNGELEKYEVEFRFRVKDGSWISTHNLGRITKRIGDEVVEVSGITIDISYIKSIERALEKSNSDLKLANEQLLQLATTDRLTGVSNRAKLDEAFEYELCRARRQNSCFAIALLDIDFFKKINDTYGHQIGDDVLVELAQRLQCNSRRTDIVGRWGGEEFLIICADTKDGILTFGENIRSIIAEQPFASVGTVTVSMGVTSYQDLDNNDTMIKRADQALYEAKEAGRNRVISR